MVSMTSAPALERAHQQKAAVRSETQELKPRISKWDVGMLPASINCFLAQTRTGSCPGSLFTESSIHSLVSSCLL